MARDTIKPSLFGIRHSNRNFENANAWGKNQFNSSFPASLVAYMFSKGMKCVYLKTSSNNEVYKTYIGGDELFDISPLSDDLFYSFESVFTPYQPYFIGNTPRIDLVIQNIATGQ